MTSSTYQRRRRGILGVQTLRNALMVATFLPSNTMFLVLGTLTLTAQGHLADTWTLLDPVAVRSAPLAQAKLLLLTLLVACTASTTRASERPAAVPQEPTCLSERDAHGAVPKHAFDTVARHLHGPRPAAGDRLAHKGATSSNVETDSAGTASEPV